MEADRQGKEVLGLLHRFKSLLWLGNTEYSFASSRWNHKFGKSHRVDKRGIKKIIQMSKREKQLYKFSVEMLINIITDYEAYFSELKKKIESFKDKTEKEIVLLEELTNILNKYL